MITKRDQIFKDWKRNKRATLLFENIINISIFQKIKIILLEGISYFIFEIDNSNKIDKE